MAQGSCIICFEECGRNELLRGHDEHLVCTLCAHKLVEQAFVTFKFDRLVCPLCKLKVPVNDAISLVGHEAYARMLADREAHMDAIFCRNPACECPQTPSGPEPTLILHERTAHYFGHDAVAVVQCTSCQMEYCLFCRDLCSASSMSRSSVKLLVRLGLYSQHVCKDANQKDLARLALSPENQTKPCPRCFKLIYKVDGCRNMHCAACDARFCWDCLQDYQRVGSSHNCPKAGLALAMGPKAHCFVRTVRKVSEAGLALASLPVHFAKFLFHVISYPIVQLERRNELKHVQARLAQYEQGGIRRYGADVFMHRDSLPILDHLSFVSRGRWALPNVAAATATATATTAAAMAEEQVPGSRECFLAYDIADHGHALVRLHCHQHLEDVPHACTLQPVAGSIRLHLDQDFFAAVVEPEDANDTAAVNQWRLALRNALQVALENTVNEAMRMRNT